MNDDRNLERDVASVFAETAPSRSPDDLLENVFLTTGPMRPRPRWLARIKEPPMRYTNSIAVGSPTARLAAIMVATLMLIVAVAGAGIAGSRLLAAGPIVVDPSGGGTTTTITEAVAMANDGDTILVRPGTYDESITLTKDITIRGDGPPDGIVIELAVEIPASASATSPDLPFAFLLDGSDAILENLTFRGESARIVIDAGAPVIQKSILDGTGRVYLIDPGTSVPSGLQIQGGSTAMIKDNLLMDVGIVIVDESSPTLLGNILRIGDIWMQGIGVDPVLRDNDLRGSVKWGIAIWGGAKPTVEANTIADAQNGIDIQDTGFGISDIGTDPFIGSNIITGASSAGIKMSVGASATIEDNVLLDNAVGMVVQSDVLLQSNRIEGGGRGISIEFRSSPSLIDNIVEGVSGQGILVGARTSPTLHGNTSCNNGINLEIVESATPDIGDTNEICPDPPADQTP